MIYLHSGFSPQQQPKDSDHGECPTTAGTSAHNALVTGHPASERSSLLSPSNSAVWKECQLHYFGSPYSPTSLDCCPEKPTAQENSVWPRTSDFRAKDKQSLCSKTSTGHCHHYWQTPKAIASASICSVSRSPLLFIPAEYQAFYIYTRYRGISEYRFLQILLSKILFINV